METKELSYKIQDALAVAFSAYKINNGYIKDTARFSEPTNSTVFSNKDLVKFQFRPEFRPDDFKPFHTSEEEYEKVDDAQKHFRRYVFGVIGDNLTEFHRSIVDIASQDTVSFNQLGLIAYIPEFISRETKEISLKKTIRTEYRNSLYIGGIGESVEGVCKIIDSFYSSHYERYAYTGDVMGNLIGFWNKYEIPLGERRKFKAKVKGHVKNRLFEVNETQLNYVKLYKVS
jgi:hypothetical protein